jgi:type I restriction enzyme S subunit
MTSNVLVSPILCPDDWTLVRLKDISTKIGSGATPTGGQAAYQEKRTNFALIRSQNVLDREFSPDGLAFISDEQASRLKGAQLESEDILLNITGDGVTFARACLVPEKALPACVNQHVSIIRLNKDKAHPGYVLSYLTHPAIKKYIESFNAGGSRRAITKSHIESFVVPLPPMAVQAAIAQLLQCIDDRIALFRETNATLEAIAEALFKSWFVDFDPVRAKLEGRAPDGMDEATAALFPNSLEYSELGMVPKGWKIERLENWLSVLETGRRPKGGVSGILDGVPSIGAESIVKVGHFDFSKTKYVSTDFFAKMSSGKLASNDVLLYKDGGKPGVFLPRVAMFGDGFPFDECGINEHVFRVRIKAPFNQPFLYFWLWSDAVMHELKHRGGKAAIPGINQSDVKEQRISIPSSEILNRFDALVSPLVRKIFNNAKLGQSLVTMRDTLLPHLLSGQVRIPEATAQIDALAA